MFTRSIVATVLVAAVSPSVSAAEATAWGTKSPRAARDWRLVGGTSRPTVVQPLGTGRALVCSERRCDVWDRVTGAWTPTEAVVLPSNWSPSLRRRDGAVVVIAGAPTTATKIWSPVTGHWSDAAPPPEPFDFFRTAQVADGRIIAAGISHGRIRAYIADPALRSWSHLIDSPDGLINPEAFPTASGLLVFSNIDLAARARTWRHTIGTNGWQEIPVALLVSGQVASVMEWKDQVLITLQDGKVVIVGRNGKARPAGLVAPTRASSCQTIKTADGMDMQFVSGNSDNERWLWKSPDEAAIPVPANEISHPLIVALDDDHLLSVGNAGEVTTLALDGKESPGQPCDGLGRYLRQTPPPTPVGSELKLVHTDCREQVRRGEANEILVLTRSWAGQESRLDYGRAFQCALQDPAALEFVPGWLARRDGHAPTVCFQSLASWSGGGEVWKRALESAVFKLDGRWTVNSAVIDLARDVPTTEVLDQLMPTLRTAADRQAKGFDALKVWGCSTSNTTASVARQRTCTELASQSESAWEDRKLQADARTSSKAPGVVAATAVYAGAIGAAYATRNNNGGRGIAVGAGALGGALVGALLGVIVDVASDAVRYGAKSGDGQSNAWIGISLLGGILGGVAAYAATDSPSSRAPATAIGLALPYLTTMFFVFN